MTRERFEYLFDYATKHTVAFAQMMVVESLPVEVRFQLLDEREQIVGLPIKREEFIEKAWINGSVPRWIDLGVFSCTADYTVVGALVASDQVEEESACVYAARQQGPFGIKSPRLPMGWTSVEKSGRFRLSR